MIRLRRDTMLEAPCQLEFSGSFATRVIQKQLGTRWPITFASQSAVRRSGTNLRTRTR